MKYALAIVLLVGVAYVRAEGEAAQAAGAEELREKRSYDGGYGGSSYNAPAPAYGGSYQAPASYAPAPSYSAPTYSAPAPSYSAPTYSAPQVSCGVCVCPVAYENNYGGGYGGGSYGGGSYGGGSYGNKY